LKSARDPVGTNYNGKDRKEGKKRGGGVQKKGQAVWNWLAGLDWLAQALEGFREV